MEKTKSEPGKTAQCKPSTTAKSIAQAPLHSATNALEKTASNRGASPKQDSHSALSSVVKTVGIRLSIETFIDFVNQGIECWRAAGNLLVTWKKQEPNCFQLILKRTPWLSIHTLEMFERIGKREIHPKILLLPPAQAERATRLTYAEQEAICSGSIEDAQKKLKTQPKTKDFTPHERKLSDKLPTIGFFVVKLTNGVPSIIASKREIILDLAIPIVLDRDNMCYLQLLKP